jgi:hypothetical protein
MAPSANCVDLGAESDQLTSIIIEGTGMKMIGNFRRSESDAALQFDTFHS